jgi:hypothetical protein
VAACSGKTIDTGSNEGGVRAGSGVGSGAASGAFAVGTTTSGNDVDCSASSGGASGVTDGGPSLSPLLGTWTGYVENYQFPSGSDLVVIAFSQQAGGPITGTVTYGQGVPPPPPTGPDEAYPPAAFVDAGPSAPPYMPSLYEGFAYRVLNVQFDGTRLQFHTSINNLWSAWCALQTPTSDGWQPCQYGCMPKATSSTQGAGTVTVVDPVTGQGVTVPFIKWMLCLNGLGMDPIPADCACSAIGCAVNLDQGDMSFDVELSGAKIDGSVVGLSNASSNVHFMFSP